MFTRREQAAPAAVYAPKRERAGLRRVQPPGPPLPGRLAACAFAAALLACAWATRAVTAAPAQGNAAQAGSAAQVGSAARLVAEGAAALERGDDAAAKTLFERALAASPGDTQAHTFLGLLADRAGDLKAAERHFAAAAMSSPFLASARNNYGAVLVRNGRLELAAAQFEASLKLDRNQPSALVNLAQIRFARGTAEDLRAAREMFRRAQGLTPDAEIARALVITALRLGDKPEAAAAYDDYAARLGAGAPSDSPSARAELGAALLESGLAEQAAKELGAAVAAEPSNVGALVALARAHLRRRDIPAAGRTLEGALARGLEAAPVYAALAEVYEAGGYVENAIPTMRLAIERDPKNEAYRFRYGMLLTDTRAPAAAVIRLQEALKEFPRSSRLWFALGVAQSALDKQDEAAQSFTRAFELDSKFAPALAYLGMTHDQQGRFGEAVGLYERALALDGTLAAAHYLAAEAMLKQPAADARRAETHLSAAISLDSSFAPARVSLAKLYLASDRADEAVAQLQGAIATDPQRPEAFYLLGRALTRLKRGPEAQAAMATFKRLTDEKREQAREEPRQIIRRLGNVRF